MHLKAGIQSQVFIKNPAQYPIGSLNYSSSLTKTLTITLDFLPGS
jgi:hypothetical protein